MPDFPLELDRKESFFFLLCKLTCTCKASEKGKMLYKFPQMQLLTVTN